MWKNVPENTQQTAHALFFACVPLKPSFVTVMWSCSFVFRFPHPFLTARHSFNLQSSIVQPVSNSWHFCKCQSSTEAACFCSAKWERIPVALGWWTFALRNDGLLCCCCFFFTVRLLAPIQVTSSWTKTTCLMYRTSITKITYIIITGKCWTNNSSHSFAIIADLFMKVR